jgi:hypothetical protein
VVYLPPKRDGRFLLQQCRNIACYAPTNP